MPMRLSRGILLAIGLTCPVAAETPATCDALVSVLEASVGQELSVRPAATRDGWCVLDGARSAGGDMRVSAETLRLRGETTDEELVALKVEGTRLRVAPALQNRDQPDWLRDLLRLQTADLRLALNRDMERDVLIVEQVQLRFSGGSDVLLMGEVTGGGLSLAELMTGRMTKLHLEVRNNGRNLYPILQALGDAIAPDGSHSEAMDTARMTLLGVVGALALEAVPENSARALGDFVRSLPEGQGQLVVEVVSQNGIGLAQALLLAQPKAIYDAKTLGHVFSGSEVGVTWTPGLLP